MTAKTAQFSAGLDRARQKLARFGTRITAVSRKVALYSAALTAAGVAVLGLYVRRTMLAVDVTAKMSDRLGIAIEDLQRFRHAAALSGLAVGKMDLALMQFVRRIGEAQQGLTTYKRAFDQLGLDVEVMAQMDVAEAFKLVAERISTLKEDTLKASVAYNMFGRQGQVMLNLLASGRKGIEEMGAAVDKAGAAISRLDAAKIEMANDAITDAMLASQAFWHQLTVRLTPAITAAAEWLFDLATESIKTGAIMDRVFREAGETILWVADAVDTVYRSYLVMKLGVLEIMSQSAKLLGQEKLAEDLKQLAVATRILMAELEAKEGLGARITVWWETLVAQYDKLAQAIADNREQMRGMRKEGAGIGNLMEDLRGRAEALVKALRDPWQVLTESIADYRKMLSLLFISEQDYVRAVARAYEVYYKTLEKVKDSLRALADPARLRFAPATIAGTAEAVQTRWRATGGMIGAATVAVQQQQLKVQQGMGETLDEMNDILRRGLRLDDVAVLDVVT